MHVYLFDIDGTLIRAKGAGQAAFTHAVRTVLDFEISWASRDFAGKTDAGLFERALTEANAGKEHLSILRNTYHSALAEYIRAHPAEVLAGVHQLLTHLKAQPHTTLALLTGNSERGSALKLAELFSFFELGFYGDDFIERNDIALFARHTLTPRYPTPLKLTVVGDTPFDIACAQSAGAASVAVATGPYTTQELTSADRVLNDLTEW